MAKTKGKKEQQENTPVPEVPKEIKCSFCGKSSHFAHRLIAGPNDIFICDECISVCIKILSEDTPVWWIPPVSENNDIFTFLGKKRQFPAALVLDKSWQCLFISPPKEPYAQIFSDFIVPAAKRSKIPVKRITGIYGKGLKLTKILKDILEAPLIIADISGKDPNVMYLLGIVHLSEKPLILLTQHIDDIPYDLKLDRHIKYENSQSELKDITHQLIPIFEFIGQKRNQYKNSSDPQNYQEPSPHPEAKAKK
jgi:hypothetical protein